jgi:GNAT superfamily N-acetyltransferase
MLPALFEVRRDDGCVISTDKTRLDRDYIHRYIAEESYWARGRSRATMETAIDHSLCFGVYRDGRQLGFARIVTDFATLGWICDVFIDETERGQGIGKWLVQAMVDFPPLQAVRRLVLVTNDAHELYRRYGGFDSLANPERLMTRFNEAPAGA